MKLLQKGTQITWTVDNLLKEGFIKVGSKTYEEYWKHTKTDDILTLSIVDDTVRKVFKKSSYSVKELIEKLQDLEKFVGSDAEVYTLECDYEKDIKRLKISEFKMKPCIILE